MQRQLQFKRENFRIQKRKLFHQHLIKSHRLQLHQTLALNQSKQLVSLIEYIKLIPIENYRIQNIIKILSTPDIFKNLLDDTFSRISIFILENILKIMQYSYKKQYAILYLIGISNVIVDSKYKNQYYSVTILDYFINKKKSNFITNTSQIQQINHIREIQWIYSNMVKKQLNCFNQCHFQQLIQTLTYKIIDPKMQNLLKANIVKSITLLCRNKWMMDYYKNYFLQFLLDCINIMNEQKNIASEVLNLISVVLKQYFKNLGKASIQAMINQMIKINYLTQNLKSIIWRILKILAQQSWDYATYIFKKIEKTITQTISQQSKIIKKYILDLFKIILKKQNQITKQSLKSINFKQTLLRFLNLDPKNINYGTIKIFSLSLQNISSDDLIQCKQQTKQKINNHLQYILKNNEDIFIIYECQQIKNLLQQLII